MPLLTPRPIAFDPNLALSRVISQSRAAFVNVYAIPQKGKGEFVSVGIAGRELVNQLEAPIRGFLNVPANTSVDRALPAFYVVGGSKFYRSLDGGVNYTVLGSVPAGVNLVEMDNNRYQVAAVTNPGMSVYDTQSNFYTPAVTDPDFQGAASIATVDGFGLLTYPGGDGFSITAINNYLSFLGTDRATAESEVDPIRAVRAVNNEPWFLGAEGSEPWNDVGAADFPFARRDVNPDFGCVAQFTAFSVNDTLVMLGMDAQSKAKRVYRAVGYNWEPISNDAIDIQIADCPTPESAWAFLYAQDGHSFYVLTLPTIGSFAYDFNTGLWHQWTNSVPELGLQFQPARFTCSAMVGGNYLFGDDQGRIIRARLALNTDLGAPYVRQITAPPMGAGGTQSALMGVDLDMDTGLGTLTAEGRMLMGVSQDGGNTFLDWQAEGLGLQGEHGLRVSWGGQGQAPSHMLCFRCTDDVPWRMTGGWARIKAVGRP